MNNIVIVESPAKAKTINKYLGSDYEVFASYGHVRDLPAKDGSVKPDEDFSMKWEADAKSAKRLNEIARAMKGADKLILATDPDREGEAISWHMIEVLRNKKALKDQPIERVVFNQITKSAILDAMANPRDLDTELVDAYLARRALDYLVGFTLSPVLWRKLPGSRSAGRVQSVALRLIVDREMEIEAFNPVEYWSVTVDALSAAGDKFPARLHSLNGKKLAKHDIPDEAAAKAAVDAIRAGQFTITNVEAKPSKRNPAPPFTTSTLQQEAARKLGFGATHTMRTAQRLYEDGLITYMRTDGIDLAGEAISSIRAHINADYGDRYLPAEPRRYKSKAKNAQEAHEAIRPTDITKTPKSVRLDQDQFRLYELIWKRTIACQMASAQLERTTVDIQNADGNVGLRATGQVITFDGYFTIYQEGQDDASAKDDDGKRLPKLSAGETAEAEKVNPNQHFTEPPPRYSEASMVKKMEEMGIGRPSTYASILSVLVDRSYVTLERKQFRPEDKGRLVATFLKSFFTRYVEYDFTAELEEKLDLVSDGKMNWKEFLRDFWTEFSAHVEETKDLRVTEVLDRLNEIMGPHVFPDPGDGTDPRKCPSCEDGRVSLKVGKFGAFIGCSNYPECRFTRQLTKTDGEGQAANAEPKLLGQDENGVDVTLRSGRFGIYVQRGEPEGKEKPARASIPKLIPADNVDLEIALRYLSLPREVGLHPESGKPILAAIGRYGPYVQHERTYANLPSPEDVFTIGLNHAVTLIAEKVAKGGGRAAAKALKELGEHPTDGGPVNVMDGRYGPYVKHGKINATLPKDTDPLTVTLDQAVEMIAAKAAKGGGKRKAKSKAKAKPKAKAKSKAAE